MWPVIEMGNAQWLGGGGGSISAGQGKTRHSTSKTDGSTHNSCPGGRWRVTVVGLLTKLKFEVKEWPGSRTRGLKLNRKV